MKVTTKKVDQVEKKAEEEADRVTQLRAELEEAKAAFVGPVVCAYVHVAALAGGLTISCLSIHSYRRRRRHRLLSLERSSARRKW